MLNSLNVSHSGLTTAKVAVENVSNNIANENTPGYKKRVVQISELEQVDARFTGRGAKADHAYRITSNYMADKLISENSKSNYYDKLSSMLSNIESIFKETDSSGFSADLNRYFQSVENLRTNPNSQVHKTTLKTHGNALVDSLKTIYSAIEKQQVLEKAELDDNVKKVNDILQEIGTVNEKIGRTNEASNDLLDKRDQLETELSKYINVDVLRVNGDYQLKIADTVAVRFNTNVRDVGVGEEKILQADKYVKPDNNDSIVQFSDGAFDNNDTISYKLNNEFEVTVKNGESILDPNGNPVDLGNGTNIVDNSNYLRALVYKINHDVNMKKHISAYNGTRFKDIATNELITDNTKDNYLRVEGRFPGIEGGFEGRISIVENNGGNIISRNSFYKDEYQSTKAEDRVFVTIYDKEINLKDGALKAQTENLSSDDVNNKYQNYLNKLDAFARTLADITDKYIQTGTDEYIYGEALSDKNLGTIRDIGLFTGSGVKNLTFNSNAINDLNQKDLDYLATMQWKKDLSFTKTQQDSTRDDVTSFAEYFQQVKVNVASDKEANEFLNETQKSVKLSIQSSFNQLVKVDKDEEMINLMKFQAAYTANAKIVTAIDEMIQVLLGLKR